MILSKVAYFNLYPTCIWPMSIVAVYTGKRLAESSCHLVRRYRPYPRAHYATWGTQLPLSGKGSQQAPTFRPMSIVAKRSPISATAELCAKWIHTAFFIMLHTVSWRGEGYIAEGQSFRFVGRGFVNQSAATRCLLGGRRPV